MKCICDRANATIQVALIVDSEVIDSEEICWICLKNSRHLIRIFTKHGVDRAVETAKEKEGE